MPAQHGAPGTQRSFVQSRSSLSIPVEIWVSEAKEAQHIKTIESIKLIQFFCRWYCCNFGYDCAVLSRCVLITLAMKLGRSYLLFIAYGEPEKQQKRLPKVF